MATLRVDTPVFTATIHMPKFAELSRTSFGPGEQSQTSANAPEQHSTLLGDFGRSLVYSALEAPLQGVAQIIDVCVGTDLSSSKALNFVDAPTNEAQFGSGDWLAQTAGSAIGMILPFKLVGRATNAALGIEAAEGALPLGMSMKQSMATGFAYDSVFRKSDEKPKSLTDLLASRVTDGVGGAITFGALTYSGGITGAWLKNDIASSPILGNAAAGALSGIPAGLASSEYDSLVHQRRFSNLNELTESVANMSIIGGAFGAGHGLMHEVHSDNSAAPSRTSIMPDQFRGIGLPPMEPVSGKLATQSERSESVEAKQPADTKTVTEKQTKLESAEVEAKEPTPLPDLEIVKDAKVQAILNDQPRAQDSMPQDIAEQLRAIVGKFPETSGPAQETGNGSIVAPWRSGQIEKTADGQTIVTNDVTKTVLTYDKYGRITQVSASNGLGDNQRTHFAYGSDGDLVAIIERNGGKGWFRGRKGWNSGVLDNGEVRFEDYNFGRRSMFATPTGDVVTVRRSGSAEVTSPEGREWEIGDRGDHSLRIAKSVVELELAKQLVEETPSDSAGNSLSDIVARFKSLSKERLSMSTKSALTLAAFNRMMADGSVDEASRFLARTNDLLAAGSPDDHHVIWVNLTKQGASIATVRRDAPEQKATITATTEGIVRTEREDKTVLTEYPDGTKTFEKPHPNRNYDSSKAVYGNNGRLDRIESKSGNYNSVRQYFGDSEGNFTGLTERTSNGTVVELSKTANDWSVRSTDADGKVHVTNYPDSKITAGNDGAISIESTKINTSVKFDINGDREFKRADGRTLLERPNGRTDYVSADLNRERAELEQDIQIAFPNDAARRERFQKQVDDFEKAAAKRRLSENTIALTLAQVQRIIGRSSPYLEEGQRASLAELVLSHATDPTEISQGNNNTCNLTTVEHRLYALEPDKIAAMIADAVRTGKYTLADGTVLDANQIANVFVPDDEARQNLISQAQGSAALVLDGTRDFASQIAQSLLIHTQWSEKTLYVAEDTDLSQNVGTIEDAQGYERLVILDRKNLAPAGDEDPSLVSVSGSSIYKIDPNRLVKIFDKDGNWVQKLPPGDVAYYEDGKVAVRHTKPGEISFSPTPSTESGNSSVNSRLILNFDGKQFPLKGADQEAMNRPEVHHSMFTKIYENVTAGSDRKTSFVFAQSKPYTQERLEEDLIRLQDEHELPGIAFVNVAHPPFNRIRPGWHFINVYDYNAATGKVKFSNQWGRLHDRMEEGIPIEELWNAMQEPKVEAQPDDASAEQPVDLPNLPTPRWLSLPQN